MAEVVAKNVIDEKDKKGFVYYVKGTSLMRSKLNRAGGKKGRKVPRKNKCSKGK